jgi:hypothetical protein
MGIEDTHLDVLQNVEFIVVSVYRESPDLLDSQVMTALDSVMARYRAEATEHTPKPLRLEGLELDVYERITGVCEWRLGRGPNTTEIDLVAPRVVTLDEIRSCLKKIRKSVERWRNRGGAQGYLEFVSEYV